MSALKNKKAVVTGGSRGIGRAIVLALAEQGADIVFTYNSDQAAADKVVSEIQQFGVRAKAIQINLLNDVDRERLLNESYAFLGDVDILVNNAGIATRKAFLDLTVAEVTAILQVNLLAPFFILQEFAKRMAKQQDSVKTQGGTCKDYCVINITSISREVITPGLAHYETSKAALSQLTKSAAVELASQQIRVNDVAPGLVPTDINRAQWEANSLVWQDRVGGIPLKRAGKPEEIAQAVLFLVQNQWVTGTTLTIDGGRAVNWYAA